MQKGFTLIELLVVIGVIAIIAGIVLPTLAQGKERAKKTDDISRLRQMAIAQSLYQSNHDQKVALSVIPLVQEGLVPVALACSTRDYSRDGIANELVRQNQGSPAVGPFVEAAFRHSFVGIAEHGYSILFDKHIVNSRSPGWLVNLVEADIPDNGVIGAATGSYQRLLLEGSVVQRKQEMVEVVPGSGGEVGVHPILLYVDEDAEWIFQNKL